MSLPRLYYTLPELAEKWRKSENDLLHMAACGSLRLSVKHSGPGYRYIDWPHYKEAECQGVIIDGYQEVLIDGYVTLDSDDCASILEFGCAKGSQVIRKIEWNGERLTVIDVHGHRRSMIEFTIDHSKITGPERFFKRREMEAAQGLNRVLPFVNLYIPDTSRLLILPGEAERVEGEYLELTMKRETRAVDIAQTHREQPATCREDGGDTLQADIDELAELKAKPGATDSVTIKKICGIFGYGENSSTAVRKKVEEYNKRFPEHHIDFHQGKSRSKCLYQYEAWFIVSKIGPSTGRRSPRKNRSSSKKSP